MVNPVPEALARTCENRLKERRDAEDAQHWQSSDPYAPQHGGSFQTVQNVNKFLKDQHLEKYDLPSDREKYPLLIHYMEKELKRRPITNPYLNGAYSYEEMVDRRKHLDPKLDQLDANLFQIREDINKLKEKEKQLQNEFDALNKDDDNLLEAIMSMEAKRQKLNPGASMTWAKMECALDKILVAVQNC